MDVIDQNRPLDGYRLVVIPMAYMLRDGFAAKVAAYVADGGTAVMTFWSGIVDESDLCELGGVPGQGLRAVFGVREEESQNYFPEERIRVEAEAGNALGLSGAYEARDTCSVIHAEGATVLATYGDQFFAGSPAITVNRHGQGEAYYLAGRTDRRCLDDLYGALAGRLSLRRALDTDLPDGVTAQARTDGEVRTVFLMNFTDHDQAVALPGPMTDVLGDSPVSGRLTLAPWGVRVLREGGTA